MAIQIDCPSCKGAVRVPEDLLGRRVQCPRCQTTFIAEADDGPAEKPGDQPPPLPTDKPLRQPRVQSTYDDDYDYLPRRRRHGRPHRGGQILALGILSLVVCSPLGVFAWVMGNSDL